MAFQVRWVTNRNKQQSPAFKSRQHANAGYIFLFTKHAQNNEFTYYSCSNCRKISEIRKKNDEHCPSVPTIKVNGNQFLQDPDSLKHVCIEDARVDSSWDKILVQNHYK